MAGWAPTPTSYFASIFNKLRLRAGTANVDNFYYVSGLAPQSLTINLNLTLISICTQEDKENFFYVSCQL